MDKASIQQAIKDRVEVSKKVDYTIWTIGLTHDPEERKKQHQSDKKSTEYWKQWQADSLAEAQDLESYFINKKGMKGGTGGDLSSNRRIYVYIF